MTGKELFNAYTRRDYSGSSDDQYAQLLMTIWSHIGEQIYGLLENAEEKGKRLKIAENAIYTEELNREDIKIVKKLSGGSKNN